MGTDLKTWKKDEIKFLVDRHLTYLFKDSLSILERLLDEGRIEEDEFSIWRKKLLDKGNNSIREITEKIDELF